MPGLSRRVHGHPNDPREDSEADPLRFIIISIIFMGKHSFITFATLAALLIPIGRDVYLSGL
jgi:hypothetical protein